MRELWLLVGAALLAGADDPGTDELVVRDPVVEASVRGVPARLRIDPGAPSLPILNPDFAARAGIEAGMLAIAAGVGPVRIRGKSAVVAIDLGTGAFKRRAAWFEAPFTAGADGVIGPGSLPAAVIRFELRPAAAGERRMSLPLADFGRSGMGVLVTAGGAGIAVRFAVERDRSLVSASAGAAIALANGGAFDAPPETMAIKLGVARPVRRMALATPLAVGPLSLASLLVRVADFGSAAAIRDKDAPEGDPDEIVVIGAKKQRASHRLEIGRDYLDRCSSIVFDKPAKLVTLSCR